MLGCVETAHRIKNHEIDVLGCVETPYQVKNREIDELRCVALKMLICRNKKGKF